VLLQRQEPRPGKIVTAWKTDTLPWIYVTQIGDTKAEIMFARWLPHGNPDQRTHMEIGPLQPPDEDHPSRSWTKVSVDELQPLPIPADSRTEEHCIYLDHTSKHYGELCVLKVPIRDPKRFKVKIMGRPGNGDALIEKPIDHFVRAYVPRKTE
jgi:hypothetical protein